MPEAFRERLIALVVLFAPLSLVSFGGGNSILAEMQHQSVSVRHWLTGAEFRDLYALSRAAPGPGTLLAALIGWKAAGWTGAVVATLALYLPSSLLVFGLARVWERWRDTPWAAATERALIPIAAGLMISGGLVLLQAKPTSPIYWIIAALSAAVLTWRPGLNPLIPIGGGGLLLAALSVAGYGLP